MILRGSILAVSFAAVRPGNSRSVSNSCSVGNSSRAGLLRHPCPTLSPLLYFVTPASPFVTPEKSGAHVHRPPENSQEIRSLCLTPPVSLLVLFVWHMKPAFVYIMASGKNGTLYIGVTTDLVRRVGEHIDGLTGGFTQKYGVRRLVYYEPCDDVYEAIRREKQLKKWNRAWKIRLIRRFNPEWTDLYSAISGGHGFPPSRE